MIACAGVAAAAALALVLTGLRDSVVFFYAPSELAAKARLGERVRIGGLVAHGTVARDGAGALLFTVTDGAAQIPVRYAGQPPDLFKERQGVVAEGRWTGAQLFEADRVLAKHDENYVPREVAAALKARGEWRGP